MNSNSHTRQTLLQQTLRKYSFLDLTSNIVQGAEVQRGGGGFSDVFQSELDPSWQPRPDSNIAIILQNQTKVLLRATPELGIPQIVVSSMPSATIHGTSVAVKHLRFWDRSILKLEKVISSFIFLKTISCIDHYSRKLLRN